MTPKYRMSTSIQYFVHFLKKVLPINLIPKESRFNSIHVFNVIEMGFKPVYQSEWGSMDEISWDVFQMFVCINDEI